MNETSQMWEVQNKEQQVVRTESTEALLWEPSSWSVTGTKNIMRLEDAGWQVDQRHKVNWNGSWNHATEQNHITFSKSNCPLFCLQSISTSQIVTACGKWVLVLVITLPH